MKKIFSIGLILLMCFALSGCYKIDYKMTINEDKSMNFELITAIGTTSMDTEDETLDDEIIDETLDDEIIDETLDDEIIDETLDNEMTLPDLSEDENLYEKNGWNVEKYVEDDYEGFKVTNSFNNIDNVSQKEEFILDLNTLSEINVNDIKFFSLNEGLLGDTYKAQFEIDLSAEDGTDYSEYSPYFDIKYEVALPFKVGDNNATEVSEDGKTLTWMLNYGEVNSIKFEFTYSNTTSFMIFGGVGVLTLIVIAVIIVSMVKKKKSNKDATNNFVSPSENINNNFESNISPEIQNISGEEELITPNTIEEINVPLSTSVDEKEELISNDNNEFIKKDNDSQI